MACTLEVSGRKQMGTNRERRAVELLINAASPAAWGEQQTVIDRLERLSEQGVFDEFDVTVWGREVTASGALGETSFHSEAAERIRRMQSWMDERPGRDLCFEHREVDFEMTGETYEVVSTPTICLTLYRDDELVGVYPCEEPSGVCTVPDALERIESEIAIPQ